MLLHRDLLASQTRLALASALFMLGPYLVPMVASAELEGITVTPHVVADSMQYRRPRDSSLGAKVQLFVKGPCTLASDEQSSIAGPQFNGRSPGELVASDEWTWHDLGHAVSIPAGALSVWTFNGRQSRWGVGQEFELTANGLDIAQVQIAEPRQWIEAATFLSQAGEVQPSTIVLHLVNDTDQPLRTSRLRFWLPEHSRSWQVLWPQEAMDAKSHVPPHDRGYLRLNATAPLPLTYAALELETDQGTLWAHLRIKRETFDISGGWIGDSLHEEAYLKLLSRLHINTGQIQDVAGYTDNPALYARFPMKLFNRLMPLERWDSDQWLPRIHAVEFLGEPQFGGGRPVPPQEVFDQLVPYRTSRLATSVTHSEERTWRYYAGLSDYPHYDAYRVVAPAADNWRAYDRWGGLRITWGAPLETIGDMCRSLRDLNRPVPCAHWSQGPHHGWGGGFFGSGRTRRSPTPDELRSQAMHALSTRITSLYWFNLSLRSLLQFPDTWDPIMRIGREIRMLEPYYLEGSAYEFERHVGPDGLPDWDLASIASPDAAVLFALDTAYFPDATERVFRFDGPRDVTLRFRLPHWLRDPVDVFRVDADGIREVEWAPTDGGLEIADRCSCDAIYIATRDSRVRGDIEERRQSAIEQENQHPIDELALEELNKRRQDKS
jgi:hypothetical protein